MKKEQTNLNLFDDKTFDGETNVYDTLTLNTENLLGALENEENIEDIAFDLEDVDTLVENSNTSSETIEEPLEENINSSNKTTEEVLEENSSNKIKTEDETFFEKILDKKEVEDIDVSQNIIERKAASFGKVRIMAIGIGGCGCNAIDRMSEEEFQDIELLAIDTSKQTLESINANMKLLVGERLFNGHGSGNDLEKSEEAFIEAQEQIKQMLAGVDMVFITGGIGRGTGSVGLVEVGKIAREMGILTIGFATLPKVIEADMKIVEQYYQLFMDAVDSNVIVENDKVSKVAYDLPINKAMKMADQMLTDGIRGISDLIINPGKINLDYADIKTAFLNQGSCIMGIGYGSGDNSVVKAIDNSINSELVNTEALNTARTIIFNITCAPNHITIKEAAEGTNLIYSKNSSRDIEHMLFGYSYDETLDNEVKVTFIATGTGSINFDNYKSQTANANNIFGTISPTGGIGDDLFTTVDSDDSTKPDFFN
ncbi:MAG: hypothetical protein ACK5HR_01075 [Mycoplasmatales bacterium]